MPRMKVVQVAKQKPILKSLKRPVLAAVFALILMATLAVEPRAAQVSPDATIPLPATNDYAANILAGISNQGRTGGVLC